MNQTALDQETGRERIRRMLPPTQSMGWGGAGDAQMLCLYGEHGKATSYRGSLEQIEAELRKRRVVA